MPPDLSLESLLQLFPAGSPLQFLDREIAALADVVGDILKDIKERETLETDLLSELERSVMQLHTALIGLRQQSYTVNTLPGVVSLERELDRVEIQKIQTRERSARDLLELKKILWHYRLMLKRKEGHLYFLK